MPIAAVPGATLYYESAGDGPPVVFLHGAAGNHISWWQQVPHFRRRYRCITIDHRGFGQSLDESGEGAARYADDLEALLAQLGVERVALVAQSMGGRTALGFAVRHPRRVRALVMADTWGFFDWPEQVARADRLREQQPERGEPLAVRALGARFQARELGRTFLYRQIDGLNPPRPETANPTNPAAGLPTREQVAALRVPALFIVGGDDALVPPPLIRAVHELIGGSEYHEFPGLGHSVYFEDAPAFNTTVDAFLARHES